jgi:hypothetical protein|tara:strand:+ start:37 stop:273 length:237 start_codon:yes stop_codon:yes gene_type:complete
MELKTPFDYLPGPSGDSYYRSVFGDSMPDGMSNEEFEQRFCFDRDGNPRSYETIQELLDEWNYHSCEQSYIENGWLDR